MTAVDPKVVIHGPYRAGGPRFITVGFGGSFEFLVTARAGATDPGENVGWEVQQFPHPVDEFVIGNPGILTDFIAETQAVAEWLAANPDPAKVVG